jgi:predicted lipoprotein with Yx(FWY)xxD motif
MRQHWYAVATVGAALVVAGCGSSTKTTASGGTQPVSPGPSNASTAPQVAKSADVGAPGLALHASEFGHVIFASNDRVLYTFGADHGATSTCYGVCASAWPPLLTKGTPTVGPGLTAQLLGTTRRKDGTTQVTYGGHPLYYYSGDPPGKIMCQAANMHGGFWYVVNADGSANMTNGHGMMMPGHEKMKKHGAM